MRMETGGLQIQASRRKLLMNGAPRTAPEQPSSQRRGRALKKKLVGVWMLKSKPQPTSSSRLFLFSKYHPKEAVRRFFTRHCSGPATTSDYYYDSPSYEPGVVARLITPSFYSRVFVGEPLRTQKDREISAAKVFCEDPQVIEAAKNLPPTIKKCKQLLSSAATQHAPSVAVGRGRVNGDSARSLYASCMLRALSPLTRWRQIWD